MSRVRREININYECLSHFLTLAVLLPWESGLFRASAVAAEVACNALQRHCGSKKVLQGMIPVTSQVPVPSLHTHTQPKVQKNLGNLLRTSSYSHQHFEDEAAVLALGACLVPAVAPHPRCLGWLCQSQRVKTRQEWGLWCVQVPCGADCCNVLALPEWFCITWIRFLWSSMSSSPLDI